MFNYDIIVFDEVKCIVHPVRQTPVLGNYVSLNSIPIRQHSEFMNDAKCSCDVGLSCHSLKRIGDRWITCTP